MTNFDDGIPLRKMSIVGTHSSASLGGGTLGAYYETQASDLPTQLNSGIRALDMRCSHKNNRFVLNERGSDFGIDLGTILQIVK
jgi:1-phosphatidylinositol phosphodiesterase